MTDHETAVGLIKRKPNICSNSSSKHYPGATKGDDTMISSPSKKVPEKTNTSNNNHHHHNQKHDLANWVRNHLPISRKKSSKSLTDKTKSPVRDESVQITYSFHSDDSSSGSDPKKGSGADANTSASAEYSVKVMQRRGTEKSGNLSSSQHGLREALRLEGLQKLMDEDNDTGSRTKKSKNDDDDEGVEQKSEIRADAMMEALRGALMVADTIHKPLQKSSSGESQASNNSNASGRILVPISGEEGSLGTNDATQRRGKSRTNPQEPTQDGESVSAEEETGTSDNDANSIEDANAPDSNEASSNGVAVEHTPSGPKSQKIECEASRTEGVLQSLKSNDDKNDIAVSFTPAKLKKRLSREEQEQQTREREPVFVTLDVYLQVEEEAATVVLANGQDVFMFLLKRRETDMKRWMLKSASSIRENKNEELSQEVFFQKAFPLVLLPPDKEEKVKHQALPQVPSPPSVTAVSKEEENPPQASSFSETPSLPMSPLLSTDASNSNSTSQRNVDDTNNDAENVQTKYQEDMESATTGQKDHHVEQPVIQEKKRKLKMDEQKSTKTSKTKQWTGDVAFVIKEKHQSGGVGRHKREAKDDVLAKKKIAAAAKSAMNVEVIKTKAKEKAREEARAEKAKQRAVRLVKRAKRQQQRAAAEAAAAKASSSEEERQDEKSSRSPKVAMTEAMNDDALSTSSSPSRDPRERLLMQQEVQQLLATGEDVFSYLLQKGEEQHNQHQEEHIAASTTTAPPVLLSTESRINDDTMSEVTLRGSETFQSKLLSLDDDLAAAAEGSEPMKVASSRDVPSPVPEVSLDEAKSTSPLTTFVDGANSKTPIKDIEVKQKIPKKKKTNNEAPSTEEQPLGLQQKAVNKAKDSPSSEHVLKQEVDQMMASRRDVFKYLLKNQNAAKLLVQNDSNKDSSPSKGQVDGEEDEDVGMKDPMFVSSRQLLGTKERAGCSKEVKEELDQMMAKKDDVFSFLLKNQKVAEHLATNTFSTDSFVTDPSKDIEDPKKEENEDITKDAEEAKEEVCDANNDVVVKNEVDVPLEDINSNVPKPMLPLEMAAMLQPNSDDNKSCRSNDSRRTRRICAASYQLPPTNRRRRCSAPMLVCCPGAVAVYHKEAVEVDEIHAENTKAVPVDEQKDAPQAQAECVEELQERTVENDDTQELIVMEKESGEQSEEKELHEEADVEPQEVASKKELITVVQEEKKVSQETQETENDEPHSVEENFSSDKSCTIEGPLVSSPVVLDVAVYDAVRQVLATGVAEDQAVQEAGSEDKIKITEEPALSEHGPAVYDQVDEFLKASEPKEINEDTAVTVVEQGAAMYEEVEKFLKLQEQAQVQEEIVTKKEINSVTDAVDEQKVESDEKREEVSAPKEVTPAVEETSFPSDDVAVDVTVKELQGRVAALQIQAKEATRRKEEAIQYENEILKSLQAAEAQLKKLVAPKGDEMAAVNEDTIVDLVDTNLNQRFAASTSLQRALSIGSTSFDGSVRSAASAPALIRSNSSSSSRSGISSSLKKIKKVASLRRFWDNQKGSSNAPSSSSSSAISSMKHLSKGKKRLTQSLKRLNA